MNKSNLLLLALTCLLVPVAKGQKNKQERAEAVTCTTPVVSLSADYCTDPDKVILTASPSTGVTYLWSTGETTQSIIVDVAGTYTVTATTKHGGCSASAQLSVGRELVTNGDFTQGNTGFTSGYAYKADSAGYNMELYDDSGNNGYGVGTNGQNYHPSFYGEDHTNNQTGARNFMLINGHGSVVVWEETVPVEPNTNYYYSAWGMNLNPSSPARLQFEVNGEKIGTIADLNDAPKPSSTSQVNLNNWERFYYGNTTGWNSGSATTAVIRIIDLNGDLNGNDFGLDDISFASLAPFLIGPEVTQEICPGASINSVSFQVGSGGPPSVTGLPPGVSYTFDGLNLVISGTPDSIGTFNYTVSTTGCTVPLTKSGTITIKNPGVWTGAISCDWTDPGNWCCDILPTSTTNVEINSGLTNYPVVYNTDTGFCKNIFIDNTASVIVSKSGTLQIHGDITNSGVLNSVQGTIEMGGSAAQYISGSEFLSNTIKNLTVSNTSSAGLSVSAASADTLKISGTLSFGTDSSKLITGDNIDLLSTDSATANVGVVNPLNTITGDVIVDRYINTGPGAGQHAKSWQFLSTPTRGQTIRQSWMENGNNVAGYGTQITSPSGSGFDATSILPSMKYYDPLSNSWIGISSGNDSLYRLGGYMLFVRGDRTVVNPFAPANNTIIRSKGSLLIGTIGPLTVIPGYFQSAGNPYASIIDFTKIERGAGIDNAFYTWDPNLNGKYGYGGYETVSEANDWKPVPGGTPAYDATVSNPTIQSGQAFFVYGTGASSFIGDDNSLYFTEDCKVPGNEVVNFSRKARASQEETKAFLRVSLYPGSDKRTPVADGNAVVFSDQYSDKVDADDAVKLVNGGENLGLLREGKVLAIEARNLPTVTDTLFYYIGNISQKTYQLRFAPQGMEEFHVEPLLLDSYKDTRIRISLKDTTLVNISFTSDPASKDPGRFKVVFRNREATALPGVTLYLNNTSGAIMLTWRGLKQHGIKGYRIEQSPDGIHFRSNGYVTVSEDRNASYSWSVSQPVQGHNYYLIRVVGADGAVGFSNTKDVIVEGDRKVEPGITVAPNPAVKGRLRFYFSNQSTGDYSLNLINPAGQSVYRGKTSFSGTNGFLSFTGLPGLSGLYKAMLTKPDGTTSVFVVVY
ncbi:MAG: hypothetical protein ACTHK8_21390 [Ginsengibacter sp.]